MFVSMKKDGTKRVLKREKESLQPVMTQPVFHSEKACEGHRKSGEDRPASRLRCRRCSVRGAMDAKSRKPVAETAVRHRHAIGCDLGLP